MLLEKDIVKRVSGQKKGLDYSAFGAPQPGRVFPGNGYRYGFNGQEKDVEINAKDGTLNTATFWEYDTRIGRRWNLDPKPITGISQYSCFENNPILFNDIDGDVVDPDDKATKLFLVIQKAQNPLIRAELNAQEVHRRSKIIRKSDGTTFSQKAVDQHYHYQINKSSNQTFQQAVAAQQAKRIAPGSNGNYNFESFNVDKTERFYAAGGNIGRIDDGDNRFATTEKRMSTDDTFRDYTINLKFHSNPDDQDNDRVRIFQGTTLIYDSNVDPNFSTKDQFGYSTINITNVNANPNVTNPNNIRGKISIKVTDQDNASDSNPGAFELKGTVSGF